MRAFAAVCVLVACSSPPRPKARGGAIDAPDSGAPAAPRPEARKFPPPPSGFATSDLVVMIGGTITAYTIANGKLHETGATTLVTVAKDDEPEALLRGIGYGNWADRDHLFVTIEKREVVMVTATAITEIPIPSETRFKTPKPAPADDGAEYDEGDTTGTGDHTGTGLVVTAGEAWWSACPWGQAVDGFQCHHFVHAQLWPTATLQTTSQAKTARTFKWTATLPGFTIKTGDPKAITCEHAGKSTKIEADFDPTEEIHGAHFVSKTPPRLLVVYGHALAELIPDRWTLHAGCTRTPLAFGDTVEAGPGELWIGVGGEDSRQVVYRGGEPVGDFPEHAHVWLRPTR